MLPFPGSPVQVTGLWGLEMARGRNPEAPSIAGAQVCGCSRSLGGLLRAAASPDRLQITNFINFPFRGWGLGRTLLAHRLSRAHKGGPVDPVPSLQTNFLSPAAGAEGQLSPVSAPALGADCQSAAQGPLVPLGGASGAGLGLLTRLLNVRWDRAGDACPQDEVQRPQAPEQPPTHGRPRRSS